MEQQHLSYTKEELAVILQLLNNAPTSGKENLQKLLEMIAKTENMIELYDTGSS